MIETIGKPNESRESNDFYATPPKEVENILEYEKLHGSILDNSCGEGHLIKPIKEKYPNNKIIATDLIDRGYGETGLDFLSKNYPYTSVDNIVMNPPFKYANDFIKKSLKIINNKLLVFARLQLLTSQARYNKIFKNNKPNRVYVYVDRVNCAKNADFESNNSGSMTFAWFVWEKNNLGQPPTMYWLRRADKRR